VADQERAEIKADQARRANRPHQLGVHEGAPGEQQDQDAILGQSLRRGVSVPRQPLRLVHSLAAEISGGKPLLVANTHEHFDHAYGNCRFEKVYCHEYLVPYLETQNEHIWDYLFDEYGDNIWVEFDRNELPKFRKHEIVGVADGYKFDLGGGHEVELMYQGGHSAGHAAYIDTKNRIVFTGDNVICDTSGCGSVNVTRPGPHSENTALKAYGANLKRLIDRVDEYDYVYPSHFMVDVEKSVLPNMLATIDGILADPENCDYRTESYAKGGALVVGRCARHIPGFSVVFYGYRKI
jgi:glyoxylase-like metal-dependent hydrolase (beta-lactamase superfamily II)